MKRDITTVNRSLDNQLTSLLNETKQLEQAVINLMEQLSHFHGKHNYKGGLLKRSNLTLVKNKLPLISERIKSTQAEIRGAFKYPLTSSVEACSAHHFEALREFVHIKSIITE